MAVTDWNVRWNADGLMLASRASSATRTGSL